jgi:hypothetical protein
MGEALPAVHPPVGNYLQKRDQVDRGIDSRGFWLRQDPFPPTKPNGRSPVGRTCGALSIN